MEQKTIKDFQDLIHGNFEQLFYEIKSVLESADDRHNQESLYKFILNESNKSNGIYTDQLVKVCAMSLVITLMNNVARQIRDSIIEGWEECPDKEVKNLVSQVVAMKRDIYFEEVTGELQ